MCPFPVEPLKLLIHPEPVAQFHNANTVILNCVSYGFPLPSFTWLQNGTTLANDTTLANGSHTSINESLVSVGGVTFVKSRLEVCSTEDSDSNYSCSIGNGVDMTEFVFGLHVSLRGEIIYSIVSVLCHPFIHEHAHSNVWCDYMYAAYFVLDPPQVIIHPGNITLVDMHDSVFLHCITLGTPLPITVWTLNDSSLTNGSNVTISHEEVSLGGVSFGRSLLQICNTGRVNVGVYSCRSENEAGRATFSFEILINTEGNNLYILGLLVSCLWYSS